MNCPKCENGKLSKIRFTTDGSHAYLCDSCGSFWYLWEVISMFTGHMLDENAKEKKIPEVYEYLFEEDREQKELKDESELEVYE